jgi:hypothetical protein
MTGSLISWKQSARSDLGLADAPLQTIITDPWGCPFDVPLNVSRWPGWRWCSRTKGVLARRMQFLTSPLRTQGVNL